MAAEEETMAATEMENGDGVVWEELPAPPSWKKKVAQRKGGTPRRGDVTFIAPNGEEIKSKRQLERYLKANPGGPPISDFDWGTGETPRRSERISSRKRPSEEAPEPTTPRRGRKKKATDKKEEAPKEDSKEHSEDPKDHSENPKEENSKAEEETNGVAVEIQETVTVKTTTTTVTTTPISCAKTETMGKTQEAHPPQIGVSG